MAKTRTVIILVEDSWRETEAGQLVHVKIYRCDAGEWAGQFGADAQTFSPGMLVATMPKFDKYNWAATREEAIRLGLQAFS